VLKNRLNSNAPSRGPLLSSFCKKADLDFRQTPKTMEALALREKWRASAFQRRSCTKLERFDAQKVEAPILFRAS
jgi:hypothetical protein